MIDPSLYFPLQQFSTYKPVNGRISEQAFAEILLTYASFTGTTKKKIMKRIGTVYGKDKEGNLSEKVRVNTKSETNFPKCNLQK